MKKHNSFFLFLSFVLISTINLKLSAQEDESKNQWLEKFSITPQIGLLHSFSDFRDDALLPKFVKPEENKLGFNVLLNYKISNVFSVSSGFLAGELEGKQNQINTTGALNEPRDLGKGIYFNTKLMEVTLPRIDVNLTRLIFQEKINLFNKLSINLHGSHGLVYYNTKIYSIQDDVPLIYGRRRGRTGSTTEAVTSYGMNVRYRMNDRFDLSLETSIRNVWNDKLDAWVTPGSADDKYSFTSFSITYHLKKRKAKTPNLIINEPNLLVNRDTIFGMFTYKKLPSAEQAYVVLNDSGDIIDTIFTDSEGRFIYTKLASDSDVHFAPLDADDIELEDLALETRTNNKLQSFIYDEGQNQFVTYEKLASDEFILDTNGNESVDENLLLNDSILSGHFEYKSLPLSNQAIIVLNEDGLPIDTIMTNSDGSFEYSKLNPDIGVAFVPMLSDNSKLEDVTLELKTKNSQDSQSFVYDKEMGRFINYNKLSAQNDKQVTEPLNDIQEVDIDDDLFVGHFDYKELPFKNEALVVLDKNGVPIDTLYTDSEGNFKYSKLALENGVTFSPLNLKDEAFQDIALHITDNKGIKKELAIPKTSEPRKTTRTPATETSSVKNGVEIYEGGGNFVVVAAFRGLKGSKKQVEILKNQGVEPIVTRNRIDTWYLICLSRFDDRQQALKKMREARANGFKNAWVGVK